MRIMHPVLTRDVAPALLDVGQVQGDVSCYGEDGAHGVTQHAAARGPDDDQVDNGCDEDGQEGTTRDGRRGVLYVRGKRQSTSS